MIDDALIQAAQHGDRDAFAAIYDALVDRIYGYIRGRLPTDADAEDLTADVFIQVAHNLDQFRGGSFVAWMFVIARHAVADFYRQRAVDVELPESTIDPQPSPEQQAQYSWEVDRIRSAIRALSDRRQEVIVLRYFGGLRNQEIAALLELDERTIASHVTRALADLRTRLTEGNTG